MQPLAIALLAFLAGCAYARDRAADAADIFTVEAGVGLGLHVDVKATDWLHLGVGYAHVRKVGFHGRDLVWMRDREAGLPVSAILAVGAWRDGNFARLGHLDANIPDLLAYEDPWRRADLEVGATLGFVSFRVGFSPGHLVDFLAGIFGFDPAEDDRGLAFEDPAEPAARWIAGDLHEHSEPPDYEGHAPISPEESVALARANGLDFCGLNPHVWANAEDDDPAALRAFAARAATLCAAPERPVVMPGFELTGWHGHALLLFRRPEDALSPPPAGGADALLARAARLERRDWLFVPAHPRTRRLAIPFFPDWASPWDEAFEPSGEAIARRSYDGWEALTLLHHLAELAVGRAGEELAKDDVFRALDRKIAAERRRLIATGGSDNHRDAILPTMGVLARECTRDAIFDAIVDGRITVGGDEACSLEARTDLDPRWHAIGADLRAKRLVDLRWRGTGALVIDGRTGPSGKSGAAFRHEIAPGSFHFYRLEAGPGRRSRSCWIYVNRPS